MAMTRHPIPAAQYGLLAILLCAVPLATWHALYPENTYLQDGPTILVLLVAIPLLRRFPLSTRSVLAIILFFLLHSVGARYSYSFVPYDDWARTLTGHGITERFGFSRNHFDRLVHFCFGLLAVGPVREIARRHFGLGPRAALYIAPEFVAAFSAVYEIFEWLLAVGIDPASADAYNGQQGDMFDSQKDMAFALAGAALATLVAILRRRTQ
jgi:putative membrane protein